MLFRKQSLSIYYVKLWAGRAAKSIHREQILTESFWWVGCLNPAFTRQPCQVDIIILILQMGNLGLDWIGNLAEVTKWFKYLGSYSDLSDFKSLLFYPLICAASCPQRVLIQSRWIWKRKCIPYYPRWIQMDYFKNFLGSNSLFFLFLAKKFFFLHLDTIMVTSNCS